MRWKVQSLLVAILTAACGVASAQEAPAAVPPDVLANALDRTRQEIAVQDGRILESDLPALPKPPPWTRPPVPAYPQQALDVEAEGSVLLTCTVVAGGVLAQCGVDRETPEGLGLGEAALASAKLAKISMEGDGAREVGEQVSFLIHFRLGE